MYKVGFLSNADLTDELSQEINIVGQEIGDLGGKRVAIYLPNSVELLNTIFGETALLGVLGLLLRLSPCSWCILWLHTHSATISTISRDGHPAAEENQCGCIDCWRRHGSVGGASRGISTA